MITVRLIHQKYTCYRFSCSSISQKTVRCFQLMASEKRPVLVQHDRKMNYFALLRKQGKIRAFAATYHAENCPYVSYYNLRDTGLYWCCGDRERNCFALLSKQGKIRAFAATYHAKNCPYVSYYNLRDTGLYWCCGDRERNYFTLLGKWAQ